MKTKHVIFEMEGLTEAELQQTLDFASRCLRENFEVELKIKPHEANKC